VLVIEIDGLHSEPTQARLCGALHVGRTAIDSVTLAVGPGSLDHVAELGGKDDLVALTLDRSAHQLLVASGAVDVGGIQEVDAQLEGTVDGRDRGGIIGRAVHRAHAHAAKSNGGDIASRVAQIPCLHRLL
jgi:hypothetical protein